MPDTKLRDQIWGVMSRHLGVSSRPGDRIASEKWPKGLIGRSVLYVTGIEECLTALEELFNTRN